MLRRWLIEKLGGFPDVDACIDHIDRTNDEKGKIKVLQPFVKRLFNTIGSEDILAIHGKEIWTFQGKPLDPLEVHQLKAEAKLIQQSKVWKIIQTDLKYLANVKMYERSETALDITAGKLLIYLADALNTRIRQMTK